MTIELSGSKVHVEIHTVIDKPSHREVVQGLIKHQEFEARSNPGKPEADLRDFCSIVDKTAAGNHKWNCESASDR